MVEMAVRAVSGSTEFQIILEGHGAEWSRQKWYGWNPHILGSSKHHPELPADASGHDNPKQFDLTALLSRDFGMLSSDDSRNLYISVTCKKSLVTHTWLQHQRVFSSGWALLECR